MSEVFESQGGGVSSREMHPIAPETADAALVHLQQFAGLDPETASLEALVAALEERDPSRLSVTGAVSAAHISDDPRWRDEADKFEQGDIN